MNLSLSSDDLYSYLASQLNNVFPEKKMVKANDLAGLVDMSLDRLDFCFKHVAFNRYCREGKTYYNHLYSDHNIVFFWLLANSAFKSGGNTDLASKFYYLNKVMHAFDCMYDTGLPDIFLIFHGAGTMLGKAQYSDYFVCLQGCTVGAQKGSYPTFGKGVSLTANSSVIGNCNIGSRVSISTRATVYSKNISDDTVVFVNWETGVIETKPSKNCYAQQYFLTDLGAL